MFRRLIVVHYYNFLMVTFAFFHLVHHSKGIIMLCRNRKKYLGYLVKDLVFLSLELEKEGDILHA